MHTEAKLQLHTTLLRTMAERILRVHGQRDHKTHVWFYQRFNVIRPPCEERFRSVYFPPRCCHV